MQEIRPIGDKHEQEALAARCRIPFSRDSLAYGVFAGDRPVAMCQFRFTPPRNGEIGTCHLLSAGFVRPENGASGDLLLLGVLAFCRAKGDLRLSWAGDLPEALLKAVERLTSEEANAGDW